MSKEQLVDRLLAMSSGVNAWNLRTGNLTDKDFVKIGQAMGVLSEADIYIDDTPGITVSELRTKARRQDHIKKVGLVVVDYLQLMSGGSKFGNSEGNRVQEISEISRGLKGAKCSSLGTKPIKSLRGKSQPSGTSTIGLT
jgi:replicative DNA helicase